MSSKKYVGIKYTVVLTKPYQKYIVTDIIDIISEKLNYCWPFHLEIIYFQIFMLQWIIGIEAIIRNSF